MKRGDREKSRDRRRKGSVRFPTCGLSVVTLGSCIAMSSIKPLDVTILMKTGGHDTEDSWEPYQEYGETGKASTGDWSCYILAKEEEVSVIAPVSSFKSHVDLCSKSVVLSPVHKYNEETRYGQDIR